MTPAHDANSAKTAEICAPPVRQGSHDPVAYTYEASTHCPEDTAARFGVDPQGFIPEDARDNEGNPVGAIFPWDTSDWPEGIYCDDCGAELAAPAQDTPDESDDYIADDRDGYSVTHDERNIGTYPTLRRAEACLYLARARSNYWPNVWRVNDHGNMTLCVFDSHVLRATDIGYV